MSASNNAPLPIGRDAQIIGATQQWLERAVIGLTLCPFAKSVHVKGQIHYAVSDAQTWQQLAQDLRNELIGLQQVPQAVRDTSLLIVPDMLQEFLEFNDFLDEADRVLEALDLHGIVQIASFHPRFEFADAAAQAISNFTNRAPFPTLHLLREDSIDRAVAAFPAAEFIFEKNKELLESLGPAGWNALDLQVRAVEAPIGGSQDEKK